MSRKGMFTIETSPRTKGAEQLRICLLLSFSAILPAQINRKRDFFMEKSSILKTVQELLPLLILTAVSTVLGYYASLLALFLMLMVYLLRKHIEGNIDICIEVVYDIRMEDKPDSSISFWNPTLCKVYRKGNRTCPFDDIVSDCYRVLFREAVF